MAPFALRLGVTDLLFLSKSCKSVCGVAFSLGLPPGLVFRALMYDHLVI